MTMELKNSIGDSVNDDLNHYFQHKTNFTKIIAPGIYNTLTFILTPVTLSGQETKQEGRKDSLAHKSEAHWLIPTKLGWTTDGKGAGPYFQKFPIL